MKRRRKSELVKPPRVLVVDGNEAQLERTSVALREAGCTVVSVSRDETLLPLAEVFKPSLVVMAAHAPKFTAIHFARRFQEHSRGTIPILYLIDAPDPELRYVCLERGHGVDAIAKPIDLRELTQKVQSQLRIQDAVRKATRARATEDQAARLRDSVTGLYHQRTLLAFMGEEARRGERYGHNFSLLAMGLKGFKSFKAEYGRELADKLAVYASVILNESVREADVLAQVDEETFGILLPQTAFEAVAPVMLRLEARFEAARFQMGKVFLKTAVTFASVSFPDVVGASTQILAALMLELKRAQAASPHGSGARLAL